MKLRFKILIMFLLLIIITVLYSHYLGVTGLIEKEYNIVNENIPSNFYGMKIIQFSDIYYKSTTTKDDLDNISKTINKSKPDIVIFSGDIMDPNIDYSEEDVSDLTLFFKSINSNIEKFAIKGNNDINNKYWDSIINDGEFTNLSDDYKYIYYNGNNPILLVGISSNYKKNHIKETLKTINEKLDDEYKYSILILHEPDYINGINTFNLVLSSHSLNGNINLPFIGGVVKQKGSNSYINEYYNLGKTELYISGGIGTSSKFKFRLFNKPSINLYRLRNE